MIFESSIQTSSIDKKGNLCSEKRSFLHENKELFSEVEQTLYKEFETEPDFEVLTIKKSKLREIVNQRTSEDDFIYIATISDKFYNDENDKFSEIMYKVAIFASDIDKAIGITKNYMRQGLHEMELVELKCSRFVDLIK